MKYNLAYFINSHKYAAPCLAFFAFFVIHYQTGPQLYWDTLHIGVLAVFVMANMIGRCIVNNEDITQQHITRLHVKNDIKFHLAKLVTIQAFMFPLLILMVFYPLAIGLFTRGMDAVEIFIAFIIYFLFSLIGASVGIYFNDEFHKDKSFSLLLHVLVIILPIIPFAMIYYDNAFVVALTFALPPLHFLHGYVLGIGDAVYSPEIRFFIFIAYVLGYVLLLTAAYLFLLCRKKKI